MASISNSDFVHPGTTAPAVIAESWRRSMNVHHIDAESAEPPRVLTQPELREFREPAESLIEIARGELNQLYALVRDTGYVVLLCDANGIAIDHRGNAADADLFKYWGIWLGGVWSEDIEGTNGIGTCVNILRPVSVHRGQHYRLRHAALSCSGSPIFAPDGTLAGVLDVSSMDPEVSEKAHALSLPITAYAARAIELRLFRKHFSRSWIIALSNGNDDSAVMTVATDGDQRIVGADRPARRTLRLDACSLRHGTSLWTRFERDASIFRGNAGEDIPAQLRQKDDDALWRAIVTPPATTMRGSGETDTFHIRPRLTMLADMPLPARGRELRGGLSPTALRRVLDHIEANLPEKISLEALSAIAGLSVWHFAHGFKQAVGMAPHNYLLQRRIERAREMLIATDRPLSQIALSLGFTDHSHFARHFRRRTGTTPSQVRRNRYLLRQ